ncbi:hypothetical protein TpMuguga_02g00856 [Theileria parva strain Muguga]|uniref:SfiI-subtelomeric related protein family member n=1 Tax=Theileria parva TaxID=5875 RepID=Q4N3Y2_THEPA|nr:uncharacterized protein TpMuguga_02g00856 [Theileria parva strain Muguga]EAN33141.1 hypothetical protein TpMuguga_02g00856 [Theileria parva strain Muguga]|eukprot:XP_765424.1 hypothetical protein [Theileria parva strain Muguga]
MKFEILIFIAILISCHYKSAHGADPSGSPQSTGGTAATLDIKKSSSTNELDYSKDGDYRTYSAKDTHTFCKIVKGNNDIWTVSGNDDAVKVVLKGSGKNMKQLLILLKSGKFVFLYKCGKSGTFNCGSKKPCWNDITSTKPDITKLKFYGENNTEITSSGYKVSIVNLSYIYEFNNGVKCLTVRLADKDIWKSVDDANYKEIKAFSIDLSNTKFTITNSKDETREVTGPEGTGLTLDITKNMSTQEFKYSEYGKSRSFAAKDNRVFSKIVGKNGTEVWKSKDNDDAVKVVLKGKGDSKKHLALLLKSCKLIVLYRENKNSPWTDVTSQKHDVSNLKFLDDNDKELSASDYKIDIGFTFSYLVILNGVKCKKIKLGEADVWKSTDDKKFEKLKSFTLDLESNNFHVRSDYETKKLDFNKSNATGTGASSGQNGTTNDGGQTGTGTPATGQTRSSP